MHLQLLAVLRLCNTLVAICRRAIMSQYRQDMIKKHLRHSGPGTVQCQPCAHLAELSVLWMTSGAMWE